MKEQELLAQALELGFANAGLIDTGDLIFVPAFRPLCQENLCGKYGVNYACPPDCGTVEEMRQSVLRWPRALVMQSMWDIEDPMDEAQTKPAKGRHNKLTRQLIDRAGAPGLMIGASGCSLCTPCALAVPGPALLLHVRLLHLCQGAGRALRHGVRLRSRGRGVFQHVLL